MLTEIVESYLAVRRACGFEFLWLQQSLVDLGIIATGIPFAFYWSKRKAKLTNLQDETG